MTCNNGDDSIYILSEEFLKIEDGAKYSKFANILNKLACTDKDPKEYGFGWKIKPATGGLVFKVS